MATAAPKNLPTDLVDLDLDDIPQEEPRKPFTFRLNGRVVEMSDPEELDWVDLLLMDNPTEFIRLTVSQEDRNWLYEQKLSGKRFAKIMEGFNTYYGLEEKMAAAKRRSQLG